MKSLIWIVLIVIAINGIAGYFDNIYLTIIAIVVTVACLVSLIKTLRREGRTK